MRICVPAYRYAFKNAAGAGQWWCMLLIQALGRQRQAGLCEFEASLVYRVRLTKVDSLQAVGFTCGMKQPGAVLTTD